MSCIMDKKYEKSAVTKSIRYPLTWRREENQVNRQRWSTSLMNMAEDTIIWIVSQNHSARYVRGSDGEKEGLRASEDGWSASQEVWY